MREQSTQDTKYYIIPQLSLAVPVHNGGYTANKLLANAGLVATLLEDLPVVTEKQLLSCFPHFVKVAVEREITISKSVRIHKAKLENIKKAATVDTLKRLLYELQREM